MIGATILRGVASGFGTAGCGRMIAWTTVLSLQALIGCGHSISTPLGVERADAAGATDAGESSETGQTAACADNASVWQGNTVIASLADLDRLSSCASLQGDLTINSDELATLHGLEGLRTIDGSLEIGYCPLAGTSPEPPCTSNPNLTSLEGLGVVVVRSALEIHDAPLLRDLRGLENLRYANQIFIHDLPALRAVTGLENLAPDAWIHLFDNPLLDDLSALAGKGKFTALHLSGNTALTSLAGLNLGRVHDFTSNSNPRLASLAGVGLSYVDRDLTIQDNDLIVDLSGLEALSHVGTLTIRSNASLTDISALANLCEVSEITLMQNASLASLAGLDITSKQLASVDIRGNPLLSDLGGFAEVVKIGSLHVEGTERLTSLDGFANLVAVADGSLSVDGNTALTSLSGLRSLAQVRGDILVEHNALLADVAVLENIAFSGPSLVIRANPSLPACRARRIYDAQVAKGWTGRAVICGNLKDECPDVTSCARWE
jgi:hypothetical protein